MKNAIILEEVRWLPLEEVLPIQGRMVLWYGSTVHSPMGMATFTGEYPEWATHWMYPTQLIP